MSRISPYVPFFISLVVLNSAWLLGCRDFFFWDTVQLSSKQAHFFYEQSGFTLLLPQDINSGHFPFMGLYLSSWWMIFGKTLWVSHAAMLPWIFCLAYAISQLSRILLPPFLQIWAVVLLCFEPTLISQVTLISPDVILISLFLLSLVFLFKEKYFGMTLVVLFLSLISLRGLIMTVALLSALLIYRHSGYKKISWKTLLFVFGPAIIGNIGFLCFHFVSNDWIGFHENSPWAKSFEWASVHTQLKNLILFLWRLADFGRIWVCLLLGFILLKKREKIVGNGQLILILGIVSTIFLCGITIGFQSLTAHRYYLPLYVLGILWFLIVLSTSGWSKAITRYIPVVALIGLLTGHLWVYPSGIAQGWDASLAHRPVFTLLPDLENFLHKNNINKSDVFTFFPFLAEEKYIKLNGSSLAFSNAANTGYQYVLLSNICNDAPDEWFSRYQKSKAVYYREKNGVWMGLYPK